LTQFETYHLENGNGKNGLAVYMRTIRAIYNKAVKSKTIGKKNNPFEDYQIKIVPTEKRALPLEPLKEVISLKLKLGHPCFHARNYFVTSFMLYGMNFTDMAYLKKTDLIAGRINYRRNKTSKLYDIQVSDQLRRILDYYKDADHSSPYLFPIIKRQGAVEEFVDIAKKRKIYNQQLKAIAKACGIEKKLTSYVSRHTFATHALFQNIPLKAISQMLGHSSIKTTEVYLASLPTNLLDTYHAQVLNVAS
jgi:integrase